MMKRSLFLALGMGACAVPFWPEAVMARTCNWEPENVVPNATDILLDVAKGTLALLPIHGNIGVSGIKEVSDEIFKVIGLENPPADPFRSLKQRFQNLEDDLQNAASVEFDHDTLLVINGLVGEIDDAVTDAQEILQGDSQHKPRFVNPGSDAADTQSLDAINTGFGSGELWKRYYDNCSNDGGTDWRAAISPPTPISGVNGKPATTYEWRVMAPYILNAFAVRLHILQATDPYWQVNGTKDLELREHASKLNEHVITMTDGVQCGFRPKLFKPTLLPFPAACADIYTGLSQYKSFIPSTSSKTPFAPAEQFLNVARSWVIERMPLLEMRAMVDTLHYYVSHTSDLTETQQRIPLAADRNRCLEVTGVSAASGTPVVLGRCNGTSAQRWIYDRTNNEIYNPRLNKCLAVQRYDLNHKEIQPVPGTSVVSADCGEAKTWSDGNVVVVISEGTCAGLQGGDLRHCQRYQQWTYDPETQLLWNAFGTVLTTSGQQVYVGDGQRPSAGQRWFADASPLCGVSCFPGIPAE